jgi:hypothetical protein
MCVSWNKTTVPFVTLPCLKVPDVLLISYSEAQYNEEFLESCRGIFTGMYNDMDRLKIVTFTVLMPDKYA